MRIGGPSVGEICGSASPVSVQLRFPLRSEWERNRDFK